MCPTGSKYAQVVRPQPGCRLQSHKGQAERGFRVHVGLLSLCARCRIMRPSHHGSCAWEITAIALHTEGLRVTQTLRTCQTTPWLFSQACGPALVCHCLPSLPFLWAAQTHAGPAAPCLPQPAPPHVPPLSSFTFTTACFTTLDSLDTPPPLTHMHTRALSVWFMLITLGLVYALPPPCALPTLENHPLGPLEHFPALTDSWIWPLLRILTSQGAP